eukprot:11177178-Lingulodinium_polyedra.AAC.1
MAASRRRGRAGKGEARGVATSPSTKCKQRGAAAGSRPAWPGVQGARGRVPGRPGARGCAAREGLRG